MNTFESDVFFLTCAALCLVFLFPVALICWRIRAGFGRSLAALSALGLISLACIALATMPSPDIGTLRLVAVIARPVTWSMLRDLVAQFPAVCVPALLILAGGVIVAAYVCKWCLVGPRRATRV